ncbi:MAG: hypothetical protein AAF547_22940 [Actinomycetota bacterium]
MLNFNTINLNTVHALRGETSRRRADQLSVWRWIAATGVDRLEAYVSGGVNNTGITGVPAHAAVCMHVSPASDFQGFSPKTKARHFQRWKVATLS